MTYFIGGYQYCLSPSRVYDPVLGRFLQQDPMPNLVNVITSTKGNGLGVFGRTIFAEEILRNLTKQFGGKNLYIVNSGNVVNRVDATGFGDVDGSGNQSTMNLLTSSLISLHDQILQAAAAGISNADSANQFVKLINRQRDLAEKLRQAIGAALPDIKKKICGSCPSDNVGPSWGDYFSGIGSLLRHPIDTASEFFGNYKNNQIGGAQIIQDYSPVRSAYLFGGAEGHFREVTGEVVGFAGGNLDRGAIAGYIAPALGFGTSPGVQAVRGNLNEVSQFPGNGPTGPVPITLIEGNTEKYGAGTWFTDNGDYGVYVHRNIGPFFIGFGVQLDFSRLCK
jgi:hypothetical protein